ncbi:MAG: histidine phosphatase family protein [Mycobacterium sp.]|nr:histidine phosphatase family protein [Mycobacterium sp.]
MTGTVRLTLVSHAMTSAMSAGRFPIDEALNGVGHRQVIGAADLGPVARTYCGPEKRTRQTAELLGLDPEIDQRLSELDYGAWRGKAIEALDPAELAIWLTDPRSAPHGGESVVELICRVRDWLGSIVDAPARVAAVVHPAVVRAAILQTLDATANSFWRIDVEPMSRTVLHYRGGAWTLRVR